MRSVFRVDASLQIGTGHVVRCLTLAECLKDSGVDVSFICRKLQGNLIQNITEKGFQVFELEVLDNQNSNDKLLHSAWLGSTQQIDIQHSKLILEELKPDCLIVDHYALDYEWESAIRQFCKTVLVIDDLANRKHDCDYLLDQTFGREIKHYADLVPQACEVFVGAYYSLLRPEFADWRVHSLERRQNLQFKTLLINMGGVDAENRTGDILDQLMHCNLPNNLEITVVLGLHCPNLDSVKAKAKCLACEVIVKVNVDNMAEIMANSDVAIGAAGTTSWERCCLGLPTIQFVAAKNQKFLAENLAKENAAVTLEKYEKLRSVLDDSAGWMRSVSLAAAKITDGGGAVKIAEKIVSIGIKVKGYGEIDVIDYANLNSSDRNYVLSMRNDDKVKKWMYTQHDISLQEHDAFLSSLIGDKKRLYLLVKFESEIIGSINFSEVSLNNSVSLGIFTNPFVRIKGAGRILESTATEYAYSIWGVEKIKLEVFSDNLRAISFYEKCGFKIVAAGPFNDEKILSMEKFRDSLTYVK